MSHRDKTPKHGTGGTASAVLLRMSPRPSTPMVPEPASSPCSHLNTTASKCWARARSSCCRLSAARSMGGEGAGGPAAAASAACCSGDWPSS